MFPSLVTGLYNDYSFVFKLLTFMQNFKKKKSVLRKNKPEGFTSPDFKNILQTYSNQISMA